MNQAPAPMRKASLTFGLGIVVFVIGLILIRQSNSLVQFSAAQPYSVGSCNIERCDIIFPNPSQFWAGLDLSAVGLMVIMFSLLSVRLNTPQPIGTHAQGK